MHETQGSGSGSDYGLGVARGTAIRPGGWLSTAQGHPRAIYQRAIERGNLRWPRPCCGSEPFGLMAEVRVRGHDVLAERRQLRGRRRGRVVVAEPSAVATLPMPAVTSFVLEPLPPMETEVAAKPLRHRVITFAYIGATIHSSKGLSSVVPMTLSSVMAPRMASN